VGASRGVHDAIGGYYEVVIVGRCRDCAGVGGRADDHTVLDMKRSFALWYCVWSWYEGVARWLSLFESLYGRLCPAMLLIGWLGNGELGPLKRAPVIADLSWTVP
jgi:hypothetical protein